jgi:zinc protease
MKMKKMILLVAALSATVFLPGFSCLDRTGQEAKLEGVQMDIVKTKAHDQQAAKRAVVKKVLANGMTILVRPMHIIPKVSIQLFYDVGSKDETNNERGIAHLIEHMIFKGTDELSESDINVLTHKLSGYTNAFTSYDYTGYLFNFPTHHWQEALPVMADCMRNVRFDEDMLSSEMKAVIQELKMYRDKYTRTLIDDMMAAIFDGHPYHYPIIGYKQDLWSVHSKNLHDFYRKHYVPNNATLVVAGDVDPQEVFALAEKYFGQIPADKSYKKEQFAFNPDIASKTIKLYRDVQQPVAIYAFLAPGTYKKQDHILNMLSEVLGKGKSSRLYRKIVDELQLATSLSVSAEDLFEHSLLLIACYPKTEADIPKIEKVIKEEIENLLANGVTDREIDRAFKQMSMEVYDMLEDIEHQAYEIGKYYLATRDENYVFTGLDIKHDVAKKAVEQLAKEVLRPALMHKGFVLPLPASEKAAWQKVQEESDAEDERILSARIRNTEVEPPKYANELEVKDPDTFNYPKSKEFTLDNGLKVLWYHNENTPKANLSLSLKAKYFYDPEDKQGISRFVNALLTEGTKNYTAEEFADEIEFRGMSINTYSGGLSMGMLSEDLEFGLGLIDEMYNRAIFDEKQIEKVRAQMLASIRNFWDSPSSVSGQITKEHIYGNHPYHKNSLGTAESIKGITRDDLIAYYKKYFTPQEAQLAIVGDLENQDLQKLVKKTLGNWQRAMVPSIEFPAIAQTKKHEVNYPMNRDQVVLSFASKSITRNDPDYDKLLLYNQIFGGGSLGSMSSRLFELREQSGLFYTINGSFTAGSDEEPGMVLIRTIVSNDRLQEAEKVIKETLYNAADTVTEEEFEEARRAVLSSLIDLFVSNESIANAFLFLERFKLPHNFFDTRVQTLGHITKDEMQEAVKRVMPKELLTVRVGRVESGQ